ncbi:MAG TPA: hypothetical protein VMP01_08285 [Pirellulaceae bacterium]|nr:hypothetical protein [Pirellulaceae bacterium]
MKGPYERLKYDLRRLWECPQCQRRERTDGSVTFFLCSCQTKSGGRPIPMKLVEESGHRTVPPIESKVSEELVAAPTPAPVEAHLEPPTET